MDSTISPFNAVVGIKLSTLRGKHVVITGASSGIGRAAAIAFAECGSHVHLVARRSALLEDVAVRCRQRGGDATAYTLDVRDRQAVQELAEALEAHGGCDIAIANAGVMQLGPLLEMDFGDIERQFEVNVYGVIHVLQAFGKYMKRRGGGILMPVSSIVSVQSLPKYAAYCGTKFGVRAIADAMAMELRGTGVSVCHILPGATQSELHQHMSPAEMPRATRQAKRVPAEQVARAMVKAAKAPRPVVLCDWRARLLYWGQRFVPGLVHWTIKVITKREA